MTVFPERILLAPLVLVVLVATSCAPRSPSERVENHVAELTIQDVLKKNTDPLMSIPGVVGVAVGERAGRPCILVLVREKTSEIMTKIPAELEGFPVIVEETGAIRRLGAKAAIKDR